MQFSQKKQVIAADGLAALTKKIEFTSLTFESKPCNLKKKLGFGLVTHAKNYSKTGNREVQAQCACKKKNLPCVHSTLTRHPIFTKKGHMDGWTRFAHK